MVARVTSEKSPPVFPKALGTNCCQHECDMFSRLMESGYGTEVRGELFKTFLILKLSFFPQNCLKLTFFIVVAHIISNHVTEIKQQVPRIPRY